MRAERGFARKVHGYRGLVRGRLRRARSPYLRKTGHVCSAQHQTDVGMSNKAPVRIDNVRVSAITDPDPRHDLPNKVEIHLSNDHPIITSRTGYWQRLIWFGSINEIDWPVKDVVGDRLHENRITGIVGFAGNHIHRVPRNAE